MNKAFGAVIAVLALVGLGWYFFYEEGIPGYWDLDPAESSFHFSSTKNGDIIETHSITGMAGEASFNGTYLIRLNLKTLETGIDIRNERMRDFLFEVESFPVARIEGKFGLSDVAEIGVGETGTLETEATITLHGVKKVMPMTVTIFRNEWDKVTIRPANQLTIHAVDFNLEGGIETLRGLAGLDSISPEVPIDFTLVFRGNAVTVTED